MTVTGRKVALAAISASVGSLAPFERRAALLAGSRCWREPVQRRVGAHPGHDCDAVREPTPRPAGVRAVHHQLDDRVGESLEDHVDQRSRQLRLGRPVWMCVVARTEEAKQDRQRDGSAAQTGKAHDEHDHDRAVPPPGAAPRSLGLRAVVQVVRSPHALARAAEQRVVDREPQRAVPHEHRDQEVQQREPELVGIPAAAGEEVVRAAVMPHPRQPRSLERPGERAIPHPGH